jgi:1-acyl-sn-glycerol-3-phosphate acyltransferase
MAKGVLGNDPFQRGAASRDGEPAKSPGTSGDAEARASRKGAAKKAPAKQPARAAGGKGNGSGAKAAGGRASAAPAKASGGRAHADSGKASVKGGGKAADDAVKSPQAKASGGKASASAAKVGGGTATAGSAKVPAGDSAGTGRKTHAPQSDAAAMASEAPASRKQPGEGRGQAESARQRTSGTHAPDSPSDEDAVLPLREPAAPVAPRRPPPPRKPLLSYEMGSRTEQEREVDHALAEALAAEVAEAAAKTAVDEALDRRPGEEQEADRLMATELATELAEAAVEEVLDHSPPTQRPERERELAAAVAAQVAEVAAEVAVAEVLERHAPARSARGAARDAELEERSANAGEDAGNRSATGEGTGGASRYGFASAGDEDDEEETDGAGYDLSAEAEGGFGPAEDDEEDTAAAGRYDLSSGEDDEEDADGDSTWGTSGMELSVTLSVQDAATPETATLEPEVEVPDATRDELPRRGPLSLVPPDAGAGPREPFFTEQTREPESPRPLAQRAAGMLSLARDIAGQALASEGLGRAMGAMNGLMEAVRAGLGTGGGDNIDEYGKDPSLVERLDPVLEFLYSQYWRVSVQGTDHVPRGAAILVANHSGALPYDGLVMSLVISRERPDLREPRWLVEDQVFHAPVLGTLFNRLGAVRASPENALRLLDEQRPLVVFPEGYQALSKPFAERYKLKRFGRGGFVKLALRTGAPIVPVAIVGAEETSPLLGRLPASFLGLPYLPLTPLGPLPLPAKWSVRFGEPLAMDGLPPEAADDLGEVQRLTEKTREAIMGMLQSLLRERRSVFAG